MKKKEINENNKSWINNRLLDGIVARNADNSCTTSAKAK